MDRAIGRLFCDAALRRPSSSAEGVQPKCEGEKPMVYLRRRSWPIWATGGDAPAEIAAFVSR